MRFIKLFFLSFALGLLFVLGGCNVLDGLEPENPGDDPIQLLEAGTAALQQGEPAKAERYLRRALEQAPTHPVIRIKLSTALLATHEVGIINVVQIAQLFAGEASEATEIRREQKSAHLLAQAAAAASVCSFPEHHASEAFDPRDVRTFPNFASDTTTAALNEVQALVDRVLGRSETEVGAFDGSREEQLRSDIRATIDSLRNEGVSDLDIAEALVNNAVAYATLAYLDVADREDAFTFYHVYPGDGSAYVGYCATSQETLDRVKGEIACNLGGLLYASILLDERARLLGTATAEEVADLASNTYAKLNAELDATCPAGT